MTKSKHDVANIMISILVDFDKKSRFSISILRSSQHYLSDMPSRRRLRSSLTDQLNVCQLQCSTVGDRSFAVAGAKQWNSLPPDIVASDTLSRFRRELETLYLDSHVHAVLFFLSLWFLRFLPHDAL